MDDKNLLFIQVYCEYLPVIREKAKELGWAICVHGSLIRDFDLIAVKWVESACSDAELLEAIYKSINNDRANQDRNSAFDRRELRPNGRVSYDIQIGFGAYIDLSIIS